MWARRQVKVLVGHAATALGRLISEGVVVIPGADALAFGVGTDVQAH